MSTSRRKSQSHLTTLQRTLPPDHPAVVDAARQVKADRLAEHIHRLVDSAPPLTDEQRRRLADLLRPAVGGGVHGDAA